MWFPLRVRDFIAKKNPNEDYCNIFISNFKYIWYKSLKDDELLSLAKAFNPLFEASDGKLKEITLGLIDENDNVRKKVTNEGNSLLLTLESNILGVKFQFQIKLEKGDEEMLYNEFILPLLLMSVRMKDIKENLKNVSESKHLESENYKQEFSTSRNSSTINNVNERDLVKKSLNSVIAEIISNPSCFLDYIDKKLFCNETEQKNNGGEKISLSSSIEEKNNYSSIEEKNKITLSDNNKSNSGNIIYQLKTTNQCVKLDNQMVKKRKMQKNSCKIKI